MALDEGASPLEKIVRKLTRAYPVPTWSPGQIALWLEMLDDLDVIMLARVAAEWIKTKSERPAIADIRKAVADKQLGNAAGERLFLQPDEAWAYVTESFSRVGRYRDFPNDHPLVKRAVESIGWQAMCASENLEVTRAQFRYAYSAILERNLAETAASQGASVTPTDMLPMDQQARARLREMRETAGTLKVLK